MNTKIKYFTLNTSSGDEFPPSTLNHQPSTLLDALTATIHRFVILPKYGAETLALWIVHTYAFHLRDVSTYIGLESPVKRCGKTTLLGVLGKLVNRPVVASNISPSAFFRVIEEMQPTLLIDEADTFLHGNDELRGILNAGYHKPNAYVIRVSHDRPVVADDAAGDAPDPNLNTEHRTLNTCSDVRHSSFGLRHFSTWCPKAIAAIGHLPETLADRCIVIRMQRKRGDEPCERLRNLDVVSEVHTQDAARFNASMLPGSPPPRHSDSPSQGEVPSPGTADEVSVKNLSSSSRGEGEPQHKKGSENPSPGGCGRSLGENGTPPLGSAERSPNLGDPYSGGVGNSLGRREGEPFLSTINSQPSTVSVPASPSPTAAAVAEFPLLGGPRSAERSQDLGDPYSGGVGNSLGKGEGERFPSTINSQPSTASSLRARCAEFVLEHQHAIATARPEIPNALNDRAADIWEPLLAIADIAGGDWPEKARVAAVALTIGAQENSPSATLLSTSTWTATS